MGVYVRGANTGMGKKAMFYLGFPCRKFYLPCIIDIRYYMYKMLAPIPVYAHAKMYCSNLAMISFERTIAQSNVHCIEMFDY